MKLATYLTVSGSTYAAFAEKLGVSTFAVGKWARGERLPRPRVLARIVVETGGQVTANDFFDQSTEAVARAA